MSQVLTSIGAIWSIANEEVAGTRPSGSGAYRKIPMIYDCELPELTPNTADSTSYDNLINTSSVPILADTSSNYSLIARYTAGQDAETVWNAAVTTYETNKSTGKGCWLCLAIPNAATAYYMPIVPVATQLPASLPLNDVVSIALNYSLAGDIVKATAPQTYYTPV